VNEISLIPFTSCNNTPAHLSSTHLLSITSTPIWPIFHRAASHFSTSGQQPAPTTFPGYIQPYTHRLPIDMGHQYIYIPAPAPTQRQEAANPRDDPAPAQEQVAANPWDDPQPAQEQAAANRWDNPAPAQQQVATNPWNGPPPDRAPFNPWTHTQHTSVSYGAYPAFCAVYPLLLV